MQLNTEKMKQVNISSLFPNLGKQVISNGCICEIIAVNNNQIQMRVIEPFKSGYKIGVTFWNDSFLTQ